MSLTVTAIKAMPPSQWVKIQHPEPSS